MSIRRTALAVSTTVALATGGAAQAGIFGLPRTPDAEGSRVILVQSKQIHTKAPTASARLNRAARINRLPGALASGSTRQVKVLKEDCQWTNDNVAACLVWDCDDDDVCVEYGEYCVNGAGKVIPCP